MQKNLNNPKFSGAMSPTDKAPDGFTVVALAIVFHAERFSNVALTLDLGSNNSKHVTSEVTPAHMDYAFHSLLFLWALVSQT